MLKMKLDQELPGKFSLVWNQEDVMSKRKEPGWDGHLWRKGAFEVTRLDTGDVLYSKLEEGSHLVDGKPEGKLGEFINNVMSKQEA
mmetsp:Transcript_10780/g.37439  ORF Transcript_10780/g.37439 Transcript_10780/m.37439 type:complete len:86 (-) Transcript_10780:135-392(-)